MFGGMTDDEEVPGTPPNANTVWNWNSGSGNPSETRSPSMPQPIINEPMSTHGENANIVSSQASNITQYGSGGLYRVFSNSSSTIIDLCSPVRVTQSELKHIVETLEAEQVHLNDKIVDSNEIIEENELEIAQITLKSGGNKFAMLLVLLVILLVFFFFQLNSNHCCASNVSD